MRLSLRSLELTPYCGSCSPLIFPVVLNQVKRKYWKNVSIKMSSSSSSTKDPNGLVPLSNSPGSGDSSSVKIPEINEDTTEEYLAKRPISPPPKMNTKPINMVLPAVPLSENEADTAKKQLSKTGISASKLLKNYLFPASLSGVLLTSTQPGLLSRWMNTTRFGIAQVKPTGTKKNRKVLRNPVFPPKKITLIGVHGWFPGRLISTVLGSPVGTSPYFLSKLLPAVQDHFDTYFQMKLPEDAITTISLEGEGKVLDRVDKFYSQILSNEDEDFPNWKAALMDSDLVLVAAHSQGTPVSVLLIDRLIQEKLLDPSWQNVCILGMAGVSHGIPYIFAKLN